jgi:hypothetical protein
MASNSRRRDRKVDIYTFIVRLKAAKRSESWYHKPPAEGKYRSTVAAIAD